MAGGPSLRIEAREAELDPADAMLKGPLQLRKGLLESSLVLPLLIQVAQHVTHVFTKLQMPSLKSFTTL